MVEILKQVTDAGFMSGPTGRRSLEPPLGARTNIRYPESSLDWTLAGAPNGSRPADFDAALAGVERLKASNAHLHVEIERLTRAVMAWKEVAEYRRKRIVDLKAELAAFIDPPQRAPTKPAFPANALRHSR
jgi:hypothetical protein